MGDTALLHTLETFRQRLLLLMPLNIPEKHRICQIKAQINEAAPEHERLTQPAKSVRPVVDTNVKFRNHDKRARESEEPKDSKVLAPPIPPSLT